MLRAKLGLCAIIGFLIVVTELSLALYSEVSFHRLVNPPKNALSTFSTPSLFPSVSSSIFPLPCWPWLALSAVLLSIAPSEVGHGGVGTLRRLPPWPRCWSSTNLRLPTRSGPYM